MTAGNAQVVPSLHDLDCPSYLHHTGRKPTESSSLRDVSSSLPLARTTATRSRSSTLAPDFKAQLLIESSNHSHRASPSSQKKHSTKHSSTTRGREQQHNNSESDSPTKENRRHHSRRRGESSSTERHHHKKSESSPHRKNRRKSTERHQSSKSTTREPVKQESTSAPRGISSKTTRPSSRKHRRSRSTTASSSKPQEQEQAEDLKDGNTATSEQQVSSPPAPVTATVPTTSSPGTTPAIVSNETSLPKSPSPLPPVDKEEAEVSTDVPVRQSKCPADPNEKAFGGFTAQLKEAEEQQQQQQPTPSKKGTPHKTQAAGAATAIPRRERMTRSRSARTLGTGASSETRPKHPHNRSQIRTCSSARVAEDTKQSKKNTLERSSPSTREPALSSPPRSPRSPGQQNDPKRSAPRRVPSARRLFERTQSSERLLRTSEPAPVQRNSSDRARRSTTRRTHSGLQTALVARVVHPSDSGLQW